jgi:hypothetical protein
MDERWLQEWEAAYLDFFDGMDLRNVGYVSEAIVRRATADALEVSWFPNRFDRFHEVIVTVPRDAYIRARRSLSTTRSHTSLLEESG